MGWTAASVEASPQRGRHPIEGRRQPGSEVGPDMQDDGIGRNRHSHINRLLKRGNRLPVQRAIRAGEVDEVDGVTDDRLDARLASPGSKALERLGAVAGRSPCARALREDLDCSATQLLDAIDGRVNAPGTRDVRADQHLASLEAETARSHTRRPLDRRWLVAPWLCRARLHRARPQVRGHATTNHQPHMRKPGARITRGLGGGEGNAGCQRRVAQRPSGLPRRGERRSRRSCPGSQLRPSRTAVSAP